MEQNDQFNSVELSTFYLGDALCGIDILKVQEINKQMDCTRVPQAPDHVKGVLNLRGRILTVLDLGRKMGLSPFEYSVDSRNIITQSDGELIGLLVDRINNVIVAETDKIETPPSNISGIRGEFFNGVYKTENEIIGILNTEKALND